MLRTLGDGTNCKGPAWRPGELQVPTRAVGAPRRGKRRRGHADHQVGTSPRRFPQWEKWRVPVRYMVTPALWQAAMTSSSRIDPPDRKSTRLNSSHVSSSYAVFCL